MKLPVIVGGAFVIGLAGGTVLGMHHAPAPTPVAPAVVAPQATVAVHPDSARAATPGDTTPPPSPDTAAVPSLDTVRLAATLAKLPPADAVELTTRLSDGELEAVLRHMGVTSASAVIAAMPRARAQLMSKRLLGGAR